MHFYGDDGVNESELYKELGTLTKERERAVNALGRIGRGDYRLIEPFWEDLFRFASDEDPKVRLSFMKNKRENPIRCGETFRVSSSL